MWCRTSKSKKFERTVIKQRQDMTALLEQVISLINKKALSPHEVSNFDYNILEEELNKRIILSEVLLLLTKAHIHLWTAQYANKSNNFHSFTMHFRVVLECAGQVVRKVENFSNNNPSEFFIRIREFQYVMFRMARHIRSPEDKKEHILDIKNTTTEHYDHLETTLNIKSSGIKFHHSEKVNYLKFGKEYYDHVSRCFFHSDIENLKSQYFTGGVVHCNLPVDTYAFGFYLDYLVHQSLFMLLYAGALEPDDYLFQKSTVLLEEKKQKSNYYQKEFEKCRIK